MFLISETYPAFIPTEANRAVASARWPATIIVCDPVKTVTIPKIICDERSIRLRVAKTRIHVGFLVPLHAAIVVGTTKTKTTTVQSLCVYSMSIGVVRGGIICP